MAETTTKKRVMYLHTLDGCPATYEAKPWPALIVIKQPSRMYPKAGGTLVRSLRTLRRQQQACISGSAKERRGGDPIYRTSFANRFGYVRVEVPR